MTKPLQILRDTREKLPLFSRPNCGVTSSIVTLPTGDYSLPGHSGRDGEVAGVCIERKSGMDELIHNFTKGRARFTRELWRMCGYRVAVIIVEGETEGGLALHAYQSELGPDQVLANMRAITEKYRVEIRLVPDRLRAEWEILGVFRRYLKRLKDYEKSRVKIHEVLKAARVGLAEEDEDLATVLQADWNEMRLRVATLESLIVAKDGYAETLEARLAALEGERKQG